MVQIGSSWMKLDQVVSNWMKLDQIGSNWFTLVKIGSSWIKLDSNSYNWHKLNQLGSNWLKFAVWTKYFLVLFGSKKAKNEILKSGCTNTKGSFSLGLGIYYLLFRLGEY